MALGLNPRQILAFIIQCDYLTLLLSLDTASLTRLECSILPFSSSPLSAKTKTMTMRKTYYLDVTIYNEHGELLDTRRAFGSMDELNRFMTDPMKMHELWNEAEDNGRRDGMLYEELLDKDDIDPLGDSDEQYERHLANNSL